MNADPLSPSSALSQANTESGESLLTLSESHPLMVVFVRHFGCTFCREAMRDLGKLRSQLEEEMNLRLVLVHMSPVSYAEGQLEKYGLKGIHQISDRDQDLYRSMGLKRGTFSQLFGLKMWIEGFRAGIMEGLLVGRERGDGFQMPGYFVLKNGEIIEQYIPQDAADHPDWLALGSCALG
ncbi:MAG: SelL-related redox protein [Bacteroidota bacterium]